MPDTYIYIPYRFQHIFEMAHFKVKCENVHRFLFLFISVKKLLHTRAPGVDRVFLEYPKDPT